MADSFTANLNLRKPEVGAAHDTWGGVSGLNGDLDLIDALFLATGLGTSVGLHVGTGKTLRVEGELEVRDTTDVTKAVTFKAGNVTTGTKRTLQVPDMDGTIATVDQVRVVMPVGTVLTGYYGLTPPPGFVFADGRTIGDASSGATNRANADTAALFARFWGFSATQFPIQNPDGSAATRGADAATDFAAHRRMTLPNHSGRVAAARDNLSGSAANVWPGANTWGVVAGAITSATGNFNMTGLNNINFGSLGFNQTSGYINAAGVSGLNFGGGGSASYIGDAVIVGGYTNINANFNLTVGGGSAAFNIVQPTVMVDAVIAL